MPSPANTYAELGHTLDWRPGADTRYRRLVATAGTILDIGGRNKTSISANRLVEHGADRSMLTCTDILAKYEPDLVDDITNTTIAPESFDAVYCDAVLEHVTDYPAAIANIHKILKPGGKAFFYVPFMYPFHDEMDYHRFTITETKRMFSDFSEVKVFVPEDGGYGWVIIHTLTYGVIEKWPKLHARLARFLNGVLDAAFRMVFLARKRGGAQSPTELAFWGVHLNYNHGFCAWVRK